MTDLLAESAEEDQEFEVDEVDVGELNVSPADVEDTSAWQFAIRLNFTSVAAEGGDRNGVPRSWCIFVRVTLLLARKDGLK